MKDFQKIRQDFSESTTCHGIAQIYSSKSKCQRLFWGFLVLTVLGILTHQVTKRVHAYLARKTTTSITEKYNITMEMPAITICNFNNYFDITAGFEKDAIDELSKAKSEVAEGSLNMSRIDYFDQVYGGSIREFTVNKGWNLSESMIWCFYGRNTCSIDDFTYVITNIGKCWTFNAPAPILTPGSRHGLYLVVDAKPEEYTETYEYGHWEVGIKVQIHPKHNDPDVDQYGLAVPLGSMAFIAVKLTEDRKMFEPWGECEPDKETLKYYHTYSGENCFKECFRKSVMDECNCSLYFHPKSSEQPECRPRQTAKCLFDVTHWLNENLTPEKCGCQPPCQSVRYDTQISYGALPTKEIPRVNNYTERNLVGIIVYFERMTYYKQEEDKAISESALVSDLGGQLGLWIGISAVTVFEIAQFVAQYIKAAYRRLKGIGKMRISERTSDEETIGASKDVARN